MQRKRSSHFQHTVAARGLCTKCYPFPRRRFYSTSSSSARVQKKETRRRKLAGKSSTRCINLVLFHDERPGVGESLFMRDVCIRFTTTSRSKVERYFYFILFFFLITWRERNSKRYYVIINSIHIAFIYSESHKLSNKFLR